MKKIYSFVVPGVPVAQGRPRFSKANGFVVAYDPEKSKSYKAIIAYIANLKGPQIPLDYRKRRKAPGFSHGDGQAVSRLRVSVGATQFPPCILMNLLIKNHFLLE